MCATWRQNREKDGVVQLVAKMSELFELIPMELLAMNDNTEYNCRQLA